MKLIKNFTAATVAGVFILIIIIVFVRHFYTLSLNPEYKEISFDNLENKVKVYENQLGVPHIIAKNLSDGFATLGYLHARDRLWQMEVKRRNAEGTVSEILGEEYVSFDKFIRALNFSEIAKKHSKALDDKTKKVLQAYCSGINHYIKTNPDKLPFEFGVFDFRPELWDIDDCVALHKLFAFQAGGSFKTDFTIGKIAGEIGAAKALDLIPRTKKTNDSSIYGFESETEPNNKNSKNNALSLYNNNFKSLRNLFHKSQLSYIKALQNVNIGSSVWAVKNKDSINQTAVLANDLHGELKLPPMWYQAHISAPGFNVIGATTPGIPFFFSGRNDSIAWGIASAKIDDCDLYLEKKADEEDYYYNSKGEKKKLKFIVDTIKIKDDEPHLYYKYNAERSPIIPSPPTNYASPTGAPEKKLETEKETFGNHLLTFCWTGTLATNELGSLLKLNQSKNWNDFSKALKKWGSPAMNFIYADKKGNIGLLTAGSIPNREENVNPNLPNPGWIDGYQWKNAHNFGVIKSEYNPKKNYVSTANNLIKNDSIQYLSNNWASKYRAERIDALINEYMKFENYNYTDFEAQRMQMDVLSLLAKKIIAVCVPIFERNLKLLSIKEKRVYLKLKSWDCVMSPNKAEPTIFAVFFQIMIENAFKDKLSSESYQNYLALNSTVTRRLTQALLAKNDRLFDIKNTNHKETKTYAVITAFKQAVTKLSKMYKSERIIDWEYGKIHNLTFNRDFFHKKIFESLNPRKALIIGGGLTTINHLPWDFTKPHRVKSGATFRIICAMSKSSVLSVVPGGASGKPMSPNYSNQITLWQNCGYIELNANREPSKAFKLKIIAK